MRLVYTVKVRETYKTLLLNYMKNKNKVINNADKVAKAINALDIKGVEAVGDDGSVCVSVKGDAYAEQRVARIIYNQIGDIDIGDGVQDGCIVINGQELGDIVYLFV